MDRYITKGNKRLRYGYTTGSCAAGAAKASAMMLLGGGEVSDIYIDTPKGWTIKLVVEEPRLDKNTATCAIRKDSGDDPDVTNGTLIYATVTTIPSGIVIDGGNGIGRVTRSGLDCKVGEAAINPVPQRMIREAVQAVADSYSYTGGFHVLIEVPEGKKIAKRTFNEKLGIVGGISILGTSGIVEPMSEDALRETIKLEIRMHPMKDHLTFCPGNYGYNFATKQMGISKKRIIKVSNFIGDALIKAKDQGVKQVLLVSHLGKGVKLAGGMLNTHSKYGDCRMEILCAHGAKCSMDTEALKALLNCVTTDGAVDVLREQKCCAKVMTSLVRVIELNLERHVGEDMTVGVVLFSKEHGILATGEKARRLVKLNWRAK